MRAIVFSRARTAGSLFANRNEYCGVINKLTDSGRKIGKNLILPRGYKWFEGKRAAVSRMWRMSHVGHAVKDF